VYEISDDTLSGIQFVVVCNEDEWSHSTCCFNQKLYLTTWYVVEIECTW
jgi:hypothetical protein